MPAAVADRVAVEEAGVAGVVIPVGKADELRFLVRVLSPLPAEAVGVGAIAWRLSRYLYSVVAVGLLSNGG
jgi:hypothetical protein